MLPEQAVLSDGVPDDAEDGQSCKDQTASGLEVVTGERMKTHFTLLAPGTRLG